MDNVAEYTIKQIIFSSWHAPVSVKPKTQTTSLRQRLVKNPLNLLSPIRQWLDQIEVKDIKLAHSLCTAIPAQCPFERDIKVFGRTLFHIPPMCKLNPFYEELVMLRFKALCYLADECGEDISAYC
ncbi:MAG: Mo-dependent nitrogenase C-terminal domain-containing protein [Jaaginema sp. PMC 1079.18]|nr:Mo-dependent nitrogenase C-terminal domain-containing protein [Jaaginema sp. PMC 1080.18]MEC4851555.1 Mo-dependent nitrogenase C-terminal domain-containing protein [Jaaginema sp. PMC 1079.18]MEC4865308.1 Mo-dependent nitrogenase C-terminal domain-containing protein [Jaaginema sp. PMC 1078.18]